MRNFPEHVIRHHSPRLIHRANSLTQADLFELEWEGVRAILKDYGGFLRPRRRLVGRLLGYFSVRREAEALDRLRDLGAHPRLIGRVGRYAFLYHRVEGNMLPNHDEDLVEPAVFDQLISVVKTMHERGVAHGDLRRNNIYITIGGSLRILDYETAVLDTGWPRFLRNRAFRFACMLDRIKVLKMRRRWFPDAPLAPEDEALLANEPALLRFARLVRQNLYRRFIKRLAR